MSSCSNSPSRLQTIFLGSQGVIQIIRGLGLRDCLAEMADMIHQDYLRWNDFDKSARLAMYSRQGVDRSTR